ncbi:MAG TPA: PAS domain-containing sensor histidine kinase [Candidatus Nitrosotalea sp.]|nr:PAS domain-containing sensor histidine kinase [Candidatus Nitrosotalea sp.]
MEEQNKKIFPVDELHRLRELEQVNVILIELCETLDDKSEDLEKSRKKLKENIQLLMKLAVSNQKRYVDLYEDSPDLYRTIDAHGIILDCNNAYATRLGYSKDELIGKSIFEHSPEEHLTDIENSFDVWKKTGQVRNQEIWLKCKDGTVFPGLLSANNLYDENNKLIGSNTVIRDITKIYEYRTKLEESQNRIQDQFNELKKLDDAKNDFLAMITHELKTPLVPIKSYIEMILTEKFGPLSDVQKDKLGIVYSSTGYILKLVTDLLDAQKIELGQLKLTKSICNLTEIVDKTVEKIKEAVEKNGMSVTTKFENDVFCSCDPVRIEQVLINLLVNAIKFSAVGSGKISISLCTENNQARIIIKDDGIGIDPSKLEEIFVKFYQIDASPTREYGGTGLGLSVSKGLVENHGGKIWAESKGVGKGTEIHIMLPLMG